MAERRTRTIETEYLARVEGEGAMRVRIENGRVADVKLDIYEPPRFFEAFLRGRSRRRDAGSGVDLCRHGLEVHEIAAGLELVAGEAAAGAGQLEHRVFGGAGDQWIRGGKQNDREVLVHGGCFRMGVGHARCQLTLARSKICCRRPLAAISFTVALQ